MTPDTEDTFIPSEGGEVDPPAHSESGPTPDASHQGSASGSDAAAHGTEELRRFRAAVDASGDAILIVNVSTRRILDANVTACQKLGYTLEELREIGPCNLEPDLTEEQLTERFAWLINRNPVRTKLRTTYQRKDGTRFPVEVHGRPVELDDGPLIVDVARDISDQVLAEQAHRASERKHQLLLNVLSSIVWTADSAGRFVENQEDWQKYTGQPWDQQREFGWTTMLHPEDRDRFLAIWSTAALQPKEYQDSTRIWNQASGTYRHNHAFALPYIDDHGKIEGWVGTFTDIDDRVGAEEKFRNYRENVDQAAKDRTVGLTAANQELDAFIKAASHDLREPLRNMRQLAQWVIEDSAEELSQKSRNYLERQVKRSEQMDGLLEDLLEYARHGQDESQMQDVDVAQLIRQTVEMLDPPEGFVIDVTPDDALGRVTLATVPFSQVVRNLLGNAITHHDLEYGHIEVSVRNGGPMLEVVVHDDGPGIPPEHHDALFNAFQTLNRSSETRGSGMGLALVKKLVEQNGGTIQVESEGRGSTFTFWWPKG